MLRLSGHYSRSNKQRQQAANAQPNYEPPQPSADFGTPEATAKIAAKAGFVDIVGVKLGMPLKAALDAVAESSVKHFVVRGGQKFWQTAKGQSFYGGMRWGPYRNKYTSR